MELNLNAEIKTDLNGINTCIELFECVLMASVWMKILTAVNYISTVLQAQQTTIDVETENLFNLPENLKKKSEIICNPS